MIMLLTSRYAVARVDKANLSPNVLAEADILHVDTPVQVVVVLGPDSRSRV